MSKCSNQPPFDEAARKIVRACARRLVGRSGLRRQDAEDVEQELSIALWKAWEDFDPSRRPWTTYARVVVDRAAKGLLRKLRAGKRGLGRTVSLEALPGEPGAARGTEDGTEAEARRDLALDVAEALSRLSDGERALAEGLQAGTVSQAARAMGLPRTTLVGKARQLRRHFETLRPAESRKSSSSS